MADTARWAHRNKYSTGKTTARGDVSVCSAAVLRDFRVLRFVFAEILSKLCDAETADKIRGARSLQVASEDLQFCRN
jgi:hypothetical protein